MIKVDNEDGSRDDMVTLAVYLVEVGSGSTVCVVADATACLLTVVSWVETEGEDDQIPMFNRSLRQLQIIIRRKRTDIQGGSTVCCVWLSRTSS
jgi:hypothetical protein